MKKILFFLLPLPLFAHFYSKGDFQVWNTDTLNAHFSQNILFVGETEFRYGSKGHKIFYKHYQAGLSFTRSPYFLITPIYRMACHRTNKKWKTLHEPILDITMQINHQSGWLISNRNRIQYGMYTKKEPSPQRWLYRNRLEILTPIRLMSKGIAPFISNEIFWRKAQGLDQNRLIVGLRIPYHTRTQLDLYYMKCSFKLPPKKWTHQNVLGLHFSLHF